MFNTLTCCGKSSSPFVSGNFDSVRWVNSLRLLTLLMCLNNRLSANVCRLKVLRLLSLPSASCSCRVLGTVMLSCVNVAAGRADNTAILARLVQQVNS